MYQKILTFGLIYLAAVAEGSLFPGLFFGGAAPDIVLILVIIWSSRKSFESFWLWTIASAFILDAVTMERIGFSAIPFLIIVFGINSLSKRFFVGQRRYAFFGVVVLVLIGTAINYALGMGLHIALGDTDLGAFSPGILTFKTINNLIVLAIIYRPVISLRRIFPLEEQRLVVK